MTGEVLRQPDHHDEQLAQEYAQAVSDQLEDDGWFPMPHFARERDVLPEARKTIKEVTNDIKRLGEING